MKAHNYWQAWILLKVLLALVYTCGDLHRSPIKDPIMGRLIRRGPGFHPGLSMRFESDLIAEKDMKHFTSHDVDVLGYYHSIKHIAGANWQRPFMVTGYTIICQLAPKVRLTAQQLANPLWSTTCMPLTKIHPQQHLKGVIWARVAAATLREASSSARHLNVVQK